MHCHQLCSFFMTAVMALKLLVPTKFDSVPPGLRPPSSSVAQYYPLAFFHLIRASKVELRLWARPLAWKAKFSPALFSTHPWDGEIALSFIQPFWQKGSFSSLLFPSTSENFLTYRRSIVQYFPPEILTLWMMAKLHFLTKKELFPFLPSLQYIGHLLVSFRRTFVRSYDMATWKFWLYVFLSTNCRTVLQYPFCD